MIIGQDEQSKGCVDMEDKTFELLTKMYSEFSGRFDGVENRLGSVENRLGGVENRLGGVENRLGGVENRLDKVELLIENDIKRDIRALYDGYNQTYEELAAVKKIVNDISTKVDKQEVEIRVIKGGKS